MFNITLNDSPIKHVLSFNKLLEYYDGLAQSEDPFLALKAKRVLDAQAPYPELREGFTDKTILKKHERVISIILEDVFSEVLSSNEIKTASLPYYDLIFNPTKRFKKIMADAGPGFIPKIRSQGEDVYYIRSAVLLLNLYYGFKLDYTRSYFFDIPDKHGVIRNYRVLYNADFLELLPTENTKPITQEDVNELLDNFDDLELWKSKIPPGSFIAKGFVVLNMVDVTDEHSISAMKSAMISSSNAKTSDSLLDDLQETFRSFFGLKAIHTSFVFYDKKLNQFKSLSNNNIRSVILGDEENVSCREALCPETYKFIMKEKRFFNIPDVNESYELSGCFSLYQNMKASGYQSVILAPITNNDDLLGILEIGSPHKGGLNGSIVSKLEVVMPFLVTSVLRANAEEANLIDAVIQNECTAIHPSVYWKFAEEARNFIKRSKVDENPKFKEIVFDNVNPLYGQVDIQGSSTERNLAIRRDLTIQLSDIVSILNEASKKTKPSQYDSLIYKTKNYMTQINQLLSTSSEQLIFDFVTHEIHPIFEKLKLFKGALSNKILDYQAKIDVKRQSYYDHRNNFDHSVTAINKMFTAVIDKQQESAQQIFPHYFERFKTDGIDYNIYVGEALTQNLTFSSTHLRNLRLWQLQLMAEMENRYYYLKSKLPIPLEVTSLILVYGSKLSIRFRTDEKRFDVDGAYNIRYEVIKKRIDKSYIKGKNERLTQPGKLVIVYSQERDRQEYMAYINFLQSKGVFAPQIENVELENLQGITGLKAFRVEFLYDQKRSFEENYWYKDSFDLIE